MRKTPERSAVVVGGGIGGLATGLALRRAGWDVHVRERTADGAAAAGAGLVLWPNAVHCLQVLGVAEAVRERASVLHRSTLRRPSGRSLSRVDAHELARRCGQPLLGIARADLSEVLTRALGRDALHLGHEVTDPASVEADLVVGADGIGSLVRRSLWPDGARPVHRGYTAWRALVPGADRLRGTGAEDGASETWGRGERFGTVPVGGAGTYVYATANAPRGARAGDELAELRRRFGRWHEPVPALLAAIEPGTVLRHDVHDLPPGATALHRGRTALVGDAGHAMEPNLGQGACLALEDAVVLAHALEAEGSVPSALSRYDRERARRVAALARRSRHLGHLARGAHPALTSARDAAVLVTPARLALRAAGRAADWRPPTSPPAHVRQESR
ncbi:FAD-dependent monooxygenase [Paenibacillus sp. TRM 82003]|uniref:FAD-dependent monooxygenase n=1 Tax=Kineococcus sp. TRM81007 TaxID=2925831 RepID=UPI001F5845EA|nr:FAD-dependent monooxygenase [Kineococcus sp. TRM81007]MCI2237553.1 FAD-dependent monooxygenase [Kineococcus sp. TRM81007]MCI3921875.1 FAD-dependent monooxygenase [Paenibacillus sp. TRM 82003]